MKKLLLIILFLPLVVAAQNQAPSTGEIEYLALSILPHFQALADSGSPVSGPFSGYEASPIQLWNQKGSYSLFFRSDSLRPIAWRFRFGKNHVDIRGDRAIIKRRNPARIECEFWPMSPDYVFLRLEIMKDGTSQYSRVSAEGPHPLTAEESEDFRCVILLLLQDIAISAPETPKTADRD